MCEWEREPRLECGGVSERVSERVSDELLGKEIIMEEDVNEKKKTQSKETVVERRIIYAWKVPRTGLELVLAGDENE